MKLFKNRRSRRDGNLELVEVVTKLISHIKQISGNAMIGINCQDNLAFLEDAGRVVSETGFLSELRRCFSSTQPTSEPGHNI